MPLLNISCLHTVSGSSYAPDTIDVGFKRMCLLQNQQETIHFKLILDALKYMRGSRVRNLCAYVVIIEKTHYKWRPG